MTLPAETIPRAPSAAAPEIESPRGGKSGVLRAAIFGVNDGLVSNLALVMGVAGAGVGRSVVLLAGIAGLLAGAFSMAAGEYVSMRVQREIFERLIAKESAELSADPEGETNELTAILQRRGMPLDVAERAAVALMRDPKTALDVHAREELGLDPDDLGSPLGAAGSSFGSFLVGAVIPLFPYFFIGNGPAALMAIGFSLVGLFSVGALMTLLTHRSWARSGARMLVIGGGAAVVTFGVGRLLGVAGL